MMYVKISNATFVTTHLTSVVISLPGFSGLTAPIWPIVIRIETAFPIGVFLATHFFSLIFTFASCATKITISLLGVYLVNSVWFSALIAIKSNKIFGPSSVRLWLMGSEFACALSGTKSWPSVGPSFKFFIAPIANKDGFLGLIYNSLVSTFTRAVLPILVTLQRLKLLAAMFTFYLVALLETYTTAFLTTVFWIAMGMAGVVEFFIASLADEIMLFISRHFNTLQLCYFRYKEVRAALSGVNACQWVANPFKPCIYYNTISAGMP